MASASTNKNKIHHADSPMTTAGPDPSMTEIVEHGMVVVKPENINVAFGLMIGEKLYECPYNPSHQILYPKWIMHLKRCRRNGLSKFKGPEDAFPIKVCPYDPNLHHVPAQLFELHAQFCPSKPMMEKILTDFTELEVQDPTAEKENEDSINDENANPEPDDNSWETDTVGEPAIDWTYKPPSYRPPPLATKAEKRKYYAEAKRTATEKHELDNNLLGQESDASSDVFSDSDTESQFVLREDSDSD